MKSIADIKAIRDKMQADKTTRETSKDGDVRIVVGMATCGIAAGAHIGDDGVNGGLHIGFGADVAVEDLLGAYLIKIIQTDHLARASFILFSSSVSWAYLNL